MTAIVFCAVPMKTITYVIQEEYQVTETQLVSKPYQVTVSHLEKIPYEVVVQTKPTYSGDNLFNNDYAVMAGNYASVNSAIGLHERDRLSGTVEELSGKDITFYVFDYNNYNAWKSGDSYSSYVYLSKITSGSFSFELQYPGYYYFVMDNTYSLTSNKIVSLMVNWGWQLGTEGYETQTRYKSELRYESVTEYQDVAENITATRYKDVTKSKKVSPLVYLLYY